MIMNEKAIKNVIGGIMQQSISAGSVVADTMSTSPQTCK